MNTSRKLVVALAAFSAMAFVGYREIQSACAPKTADAHGHGHGHSHGHGPSDEHANEGFGARYCEAGLWAAASAALGMGEPKAEVASKDAHKDGADGHDHAAGEKGDGHKHSEKDGHDHKEGDGHDHKQSDGHAHGAAESAEGLIKLSAAQITALGVEMAPVMSGKLATEVSVPGRVAVNANKQARIVPKLAGTAGEIKKQLGEAVTKGELLAVIESKEMADAKAEYLASWRAEELAKSVLVREERLWKMKVSAEQDFLAARNGQQAAQIKLDLAHQKLHAIGLDEDEIAAIPKLGDEAGYRSFEIRSPIDGRITARDIVMGQTVAVDKEIFTVADLATVWIEMAVPPADLPFAREGQDVRVESAAKTGLGKIVALSPVIDPETRSAKAIAEVDNAAGDWRIGDYVNARLVAGEQEANLIAPKSALQTLNGKKSVFVSEGGGFRAREVATGREDGKNVEILSGLEFGETIAITETFTLKAELGKSEAEHEH